jgi:hypothetical protein
MTPLVNYEIANFDSFLVGLDCTRAASTQQRFYAVLEFSRAEGLRQIIIGPCLKSLDLV